MESDRYICFYFHGWSLIYHYNVNNIFLNFGPDDQLEYSWVYDINTWYNIIYTREGDEHKLYLNGNPVFIGYDSAGFVDDDRPLQIGTWVGENDGYRMDGIIDEFRILNVCRSQDWILTSYLNQDDPSGFVSIGPEEPAT